MSDYLKHLAARSLNRAPAIQPRLASRFEPPSLAAAPPFSEPALDGGQPDIEADTGRLHQSESHAPTHTESPGRASGHAPDATDASTHSGASLENRPPDDSSQTPDASSSRPPRQASPSSVFAPSSVREFAHTSAQSTGETARTPPAQTTPDDARLRLQNTDDAHGRSTAATAHESALERSIRRIVAGEFEARDAKAQTGDSPRSHARTGDRARPAIIPVATVASRARESSREQPDASAAQTLPPVIRVTIGRIEVRAVAPPATTGQRGEARRATAAEARPDPARSLREYLKQRSGGRP